MPTASNLLETEQRLFDDTAGGGDGTELASAYMRVAGAAFQQAVREIQPDEDLVAAKNDQGGNNQGSVINPPLL